MTRSTQVTPTLHSAGATVLHRSPFDNLEVPVSAEALSDELHARWVKPFYMSILGNLDGREALLRPVYDEVDAALIDRLLSVFDWRPRIVGAYFVALRRAGEFEERIGRLPLRSDVCSAGHGYCLALARLNTPRAVGFLREYLGYYLTRRDLYFDQSSAMSALLHLDATNGTTHAAALRPAWEDFVRDKTGWNLEGSYARFVGQLRAIDETHTRCARPAAT